MTVNDDSLRDGDSTGSDQSTVADGGAVVSTLPVNRSAGVVKVNLLPPELGEERVLRKIQLGAAAAVAVAAALVGVLYYQQSQSLSDAKDSLVRAQAQQARLQAEQTRLGNVDVLFKQVDAADAMLASASAYEIHMSSFLDELALRQPQNIYYGQVSISETPGGLPLAGAAPGAVAGAVPVAAAGAPAAGLGTISVTGVGLNHGDVANWLDSFAQVTGVNNVYLTGSTEALVGQGLNKVSTVNWTTTAQLTLAALSGPDDDGSGSK